MRLKGAIALVEHVAARRLVEFAKGSRHGRIKANEPVERPRRRAIERWRRAGSLSGTGTIELNRIVRAEGAGMAARHGRDASVRATEIDRKRAASYLRQLLRSWTDLSAPIPSASDLVVAAAHAGVQPAPRWGEVPDRDLLDLTALAGDLGRLARGDRSVSMAALIKGGYEIERRSLSPDNRAASDLLRATVRAQFLMLTPVDPDASRAIPGIASIARVSSALDLQSILTLQFEVMRTGGKSPAAAMVIAARLRIEAQIPGSCYLFSLADLVFRDILRALDGRGDAPPSSLERANLKRALERLERAAADQRVAEMIEAAQSVRILADDGEETLPGLVELASSILLDHRG